MVPREISHFGKHISCVWGSEFNDGSLKCSCHSNECLSTLCKYLCVCLILCKNWCTSKWFQLLHTKRMRFVTALKKVVSHAFTYTSHNLIKSLTEIDIICSQNEDLLLFVMCCTFDSVLYYLQSTTEILSLYLRISSIHKCGVNCILLIIQVRTNEFLVTMSCQLKQ